MAPLAAVGAQGTPAAARAALDEGRAHLEDYEFESAASALRRGVDALLESGSPADTTLLAEGLVDLAVASMRSGDRAGAQAALADLARFCPDHVVRGARYPPVFLREAESARLAVEQGPHASLSIEGPRGAEVLIDGRPAGVLPVRLAVPEGRHRVSVGAQAKVVTVGAQGGAVRFERAAGGGVALDPADGEEDARWAQRDGARVPEAALQAGAPGRRRRRPGGRARPVVGVAAGRSGDGAGHRRDGLRRPAGHGSAGREQMTRW